MQVNHISETDILQRAKTVIAQAVEGETGVHLQRTSPGMAGIFVRGLTGNKVNVFIDGVRYSNGAQRGGVNTFLDLHRSFVRSTGSKCLRGTIQRAVRQRRARRQRAVSDAHADALAGHRAARSAAPSSADSRPRTTAASARRTSTTRGRTSASPAASRHARPATSARAAANDSHSAIARFLGLSSSDFYRATRMPDTGFTQNGVQVRANWVPSPTICSSSPTTCARARTARTAGIRLLGGDGNLIAELNDLQLDLFYARIESSQRRRGSIGRRATYSFNTQREERVNQGGNGNPNALIAHEPERTTVERRPVQRVEADQLAHQPAGRRRHVFREAHLGRVRRQSRRPAPRRRRRPRVPDQATYHQGGLFGQITYRRRAGPADARSARCASATTRTARMRRMRRSSTASRCGRMTHSSDASVTFRARRGVSRDGGPDVHRRRSRAVIARRT